MISQDLVADFEIHFNTIFDKLTLLYFIGVVMKAEDLQKINSGLNPDFFNFLAEELSKTVSIAGKITIVDFCIEISNKECVYMVFRLIQFVYKSLFEQLLVTNYHQYDIKNKLGPKTNHRIQLIRRVEFFINCLKNNEDQSNIFKYLEVFEQIQQFF